MLGEIIRRAEKAQKERRKERLLNLSKLAGQMALEAKNRARNLLRKKMARLYSQIESERARLLAALKDSESEIKSIENQLTALSGREEVFTSKIRQLLGRLKSCQEWAQFSREIISAIGCEAEMAQPDGKRIDFVNGLKELDRDLEARKRVRREINDLLRARKEARRERAKIEGRLAELNRARQEVYGICLIDPEVERLWARYEHFMNRATCFARLARRGEPKEEEKNETRGLRLNEVARVRFDEASLAAWEKAVKLGLVK